MRWDWYQAVSGPCGRIGERIKRPRLNLHKSVPGRILVAVFVPLTSNVMESPSRSRGTRGWGFQSGRARNKALTLRAVSGTVCFRYYLGRGREADVG